MKTKIDISILLTREDVLELVADRTGRRVPEDAEVAFTDGLVWTIEALASDDEQLRVKWSEFIEEGADTDSPESQHEPDCGGC